MNGSTPTLASHTLTTQQALASLQALQRQHWPAGTPTTLHYPLGEISLGAMLAEWAQRQPDKPAVIFYGHVLTYAALHRLSDRFAALLHNQGVRPGHRVAVMLGNCPQFHIAFYGVLKLGAVHVPVNPMFKAEELVYELHDSGAQTLLVGDTLADLVLQVQARTALQRVLVTHQGELIPAQPTLPVPESLQTPKHVPAGTTDLLPALAACNAPTPALATDLDAIAALNYTGGTTGMPKGCVHTQRDMVYTAASSGTVSRSAGPADTTLNYMAMFWIAGQNAGLLYPLFGGGTLVLLARWDALAALQAVQHYRVTRIGMVVDNAVELLDHPQAAQFNLRSLQATRVSSFVKKLNPDLRARWRALTGSIMVEAAWGMTETHTSDTFTLGFQDDDLDLRGQPGFVGLPVPGTHILVCDWATGAPLPLGTEGEIVVSTPSLLKAYWQQAAATAESLKDGWFHTGDIGVFDAMGCLHFLGRRKEMLKVRGMSVFPSEIEALLGRHPAVLGSAVLGRPDVDAGEVPVAFVLLQPAAALTAADLTVWCRAQMASYKVPELRFVMALPMTATGKVKKHELLPLLQAAASLPANTPP